MLTIFWLWIRAFVSVTSCVIIAGIIWILTKNWRDMHQGISRVIDIILYIYFGGAGLYATWTFFTTETQPEHDRGAILCSALILPYGIICFFGADPNYALSVSLTILGIGFLLESGYIRRN